MNDKNTKNTKSKNINSKIGPVMQKTLLLLMGGLALGLSGRPDAYFRILKGIARDWQIINRKALYSAVRKLYQSKLIDLKENTDGTTTLVLTENGKQRALCYDLDKIQIQKPSRWDHFWRLVIFDIPEKKKKAREALSNKLIELGFYRLQKSAFIYPYQCQDEIEFLIEIFNLRQYVRLLIVKETDIDLDLKNRFRLS